jgi:hypothetical protein
MIGVYAGWEDYLYQYMAKSAMCFMYSTIRYDYLQTLDLLESIPYGSRLWLSREFAIHGRAPV